MRYLFFCLMFVALFSACKKNNPKRVIDEREFKMGFTSWPYAATQSAVDNTYDFISTNGDIYSEHLDNKVPWGAWMNGEPLPQAFLDAVQDKVNRKPADTDLLLSVSFLNNARDGIMEDFNNNLPPYTSLSDSALVEAYVKHVSYLVDELQPSYLIYSIESNELFVNNDALWLEFRDLMSEVGVKLKSKYPNLQMAESITLHSWYNSLEDEDYLSAVRKIANSGNFAAISFYPFFKGLSSQSDFQKAFDFLHSEVSIPVAFVETSHLAEDLVVSSLNLNIKGYENEQEDYVKSLLVNAHNQNYKFVIWWTYRDFDALWETFPDEVKDLGRIWRDTGLQDENGKDRKSMKLWREIFAK